jgi:hypothetical protein
MNGILRHCALNEIQAVLRVSKAELTIAVRAGNPKSPSLVANLRHIEHHCHKQI